MFTKIYQSTGSNITRSIVVSSHHNRFKKRGKREESLPRQEATFDTKSYRDGLQRAFNKAKQQIYFNPDMNKFATLTYQGSDHTIDDVMQDLKIFFLKEKRHGNHNIKYIWIAEYQKRGSIHVHLITNGNFTTHVNDNGYDQLTFWEHGWNSFLTIKDFDRNFKPYLYLFKYMRKAQRIGKSFIHASRNLNNFIEIKDTEIDYDQWNTINQERTKVTINENTFNFYRYYLEHVTITPQHIIGDQKWLQMIQTKVQALKLSLVLEKRAKSLTEQSKSP